MVVHMLYILESTEMKTIAEPLQDHWTTIQLDMHMVKLRESQVHYATF